MAKPTQTNFNEAHRGPVLYANARNKGNFLVVSAEYTREQARDVINEWLDDHTITATSWGRGHVTTDQVQTYDVAWRKNPDGREMEFCVVLNGGGIYRGKGVRL